MLGLSSVPTVPPKKIKEMSELHREAGRKGGELDAKLTAESLQGLKVKLKKQTAFVKVWNSKGCKTRTSVAVWKPGEEYSILTRGFKGNRTRICVGHYAHQSYSEPKAKAGFMTIEVTDMGSWAVSQGSSDLNTARGELGARQGG